MEEYKKREGFQGEKIVVFPRNFLQSVSADPLVDPLYPTDIGFFPDAQFHYRERPEGCEQNILIYCMKGEGFVQLEGKKRPVKKDSLFVIPNGIPHSYGSDDKNPWSIFWVHFSGYNSKNYIRHTSLENPIVKCPMDKLSKIRFLFEDIFNILDKGFNNESMVYVSQVIANLLGIFFFHNQGYKLGLKDINIHIEESIQYMTYHLDKPLTLNQLSVQANLSPTHYSYLFKKRTGFSPIEYFIRLKIQKACQYLDTTDFSINKIAGILGFQDPYYFSRVFRKIMQQSPSLYREVQKG